MKKNLPFLLVLLIFSACTKDDTTLVKPDFDGPVVETSIKTYPEPPATEPGEFCNDDLNLYLIGEQSIPHGSILVNNDEQNLYVTFQTDEGWSLYQTGLYAGTVENIPLDVGGEPDPFQFEVVIHGYIGLTGYTYVIPLSELYECFIISAVAKVVQLDAGGNMITYDIVWTKDNLFVDIFAKDTWGGGYAEYCLQECETPCYGEETAWSFGTTFTSLTGTTRWGWYSEYTIGTAEEYTIYAGQYYDIGTLYVSDDGITLTVSYQTDGWAVMGLAHLYVGTETELENDYMNKKGTPVPGHFPYTQSSDPYVNNFTFEIPLSEIDFDGENLIIAAHADSYLPVECED